MYSFHQINKVTRKNNHGAYLLENNQIDEGVAMICAALEDFQQLQQSCPNGVSSESSSEGTSSSSWIIRLAEEERIKGDTNSLAPTNDNDQQDDDEEEGLFFYKRPLPIPEQQLQRLQEHELQWTDHVTELSFTIIFNLALGYQRQATLRSPTNNNNNNNNNNDEEQQRQQQQQRRWALLHKSQSLYEIAYELMMSKPEAFSVNLSLVVSNNLGQVLQATQDYARAHACFSHLLSIVMYLKDCGSMDGNNSNSSSSSSSSSSLGKSSRLMDGFLKSTTYLVLQPATAAAA